MLAACVLVSLSCLANAQFIGAEDYALARAAAEKTALVCEDFEPLEAEEKERAKELLYASSANNILRELIEEGNGEDPVVLIQEKAQDPMLVARVAGPLVACIVLILIYFSCCCWCGCCRYCRCCKRDWQCRAPCKLLFLLLLVSIGVALTVSAFLALRGLEAASDGLVRTECSSAQLMNTTLSGKEDPFFLGLIPLLEMFQSLSDSLDQDSKFITDIRGILDNTKEISTAVLLLSQSMSLLNDMMMNEANIHPRKSDASSLLHQCLTCEELSGALSPAVETLDGSVGQALEMVRAEVEAQLSGEKLQELRSSMTAFSEPIQTFKETLGGFFRPLIEADVLDVAREQMDTAGMAVAASFAALALLLNLCGILSVLCWCCSGQGNPKARVHRCACCTWCCGCWYLFLAFLVGGLLNVVTVPLASFCLILDDLDGDLLMDISAMANVNLSGAVGSVAIDLVENCVNPDIPGNPGLMDILKTPSSNGTMVTMNEKIVGEVTSQITQQFNALGSSQSSGVESLGDSNAIKMLIETISNFSIDSMMIPVADQIAPYAGMTLVEELNMSLYTSGACTDTIVEGTSYYGIESFATNLSNYCCPSGAQVGTTCAKSVDCTVWANALQDQACTAAKSYMEIKQALRTEVTFKCKAFRGSDGSKCTIENMFEVSGIYQNDCFVNGTLETMEYNCNLEDFATLVTSFSKQLNRSVQRLDEVTATVLASIATDMKALVEENLLQPIEHVVEGVTCGFMATMYQDFVDGMCFRGVWGFTAIVASYVASAVLTIFLVILVYFIWRFALDSYEFDMKPLRTPDRE